MATIESDLTAFLAGSTGGHPSQWLQNSASARQLHECALRLLAEAPAAAKKAVLDFYAQVLEHVAGLYFRKKREGREYAEGRRVLDKLKVHLEDLVRTQRRFWGPTVTDWALTLLGSLSSKYSEKVLAGLPASNALSLHETLPLWLNCHATQSLIDITTSGIDVGLKANDIRATETAVSTLLDISVKHSPHFDWVVAHIGSCFPDTIITRVLSVGLRDFAQYAAAQQKKDGQFNVAKIPKINSVVGILGHLAATHQPEIQSALIKMVMGSLNQPKKTMSPEDVAIVPFVLYLASLSEMLVPILLADIRTKITPDIAQKIAHLFEQWEDSFFPEEDSLVNLVVHLIVISECHSPAVLSLLLDLGSGENDQRDVQNGARLIVDLVLAELLSMVHQTPKHFSEDIPVLKGFASCYESFLERYLLSEDAFQRKSVILLLNYLSLYQGRTVAVNVVKYCLDHAEGPEELGIMLEFLKDTELWITDIVKVAVSQSIKTKGRDPKRFLVNLVQILHYQSLPISDQKIKVLSQFATPAQEHIEGFLPMLSILELVPHVLEILHFVPLQAEAISVSGLHRICHCFVQTIFNLIQDKTTFESSPKIKLIGLCVKTLLTLSKVPVALAITTRFLVEGAFHSKFSELFTGREFEGSKAKDTLKSRVKLIDENLKFGSMPTHPMGTSTAFHAGIIGEGKRFASKTNLFTPKEIDENQYLFVTVLFKICHHGTRDESKEACKQLALLLVEIFSPDVMYNGLPWPEEEFMKVTVERDLKIAKKIEAHPLVWKILFGLAEARPSLCYTSVLIRGLMAVQLSFWQASVSVKAADCPKQLTDLKKILELMSVGQFLPHPLNSVSDVIHVFHAFHVHCVLVDIWNFMRDNVPSPVAFASNSEGVLFREFEPYKNYQDYCARLRLIMVEHIDRVPLEFKRFFVDVALKNEASLHIAMEY